jgi:hypothetical protein
MPRSPYSSPWARLTERVTEEMRGHSTPCWIGHDTRGADRCGYQRIHCYIPGAGSTNRKMRMTAHMLTFVVQGLRAAGYGDFVTWNDVYLGVLEVRESECDLDHECEEPACRNPAHLRLLTKAEHKRQTRERMWARRAVRQALADDFVEYELEF